MNKTDEAAVGILKAVGTLKEIVELVAKEKEELHGLSKQAEKAVDDQQREVERRRQALAMEEESLLYLRERSAIISAALTIASGDKQCDPRLGKLWESVCSALKSFVTSTGK